MHTSVLLIALGLIHSAALDSPAWMTDYDSARRTGREEQKPLAVFIGSGVRGWHRVTKEGKLGKDTSRLLADEYVCVYVDSDLPWGKKLASAFELPDGLGLVISDRTGQLQAYHHVGELANEDLVRHLQRYADAEHFVRTTETDASQRVSYYRSEPPPSYYAPQPAFSYPTRSC